MGVKLCAHAEGGMYIEDFSEYAAEEDTLA
jgi:hypothetical protein